MGLLFRCPRFGVRAMWNLDNSWVIGVGNLTPSESGFNLRSIVLTDELQRVKRGIFDLFAFEVELNDFVIVDHVADHAG